MHKTDSPPPLRHGAYERLRFIEGRLFWEGRINRSDLMDAFGISPAQAAIDFREYLNRAGDGLAYDTRAKTYKTTDSFQPVLGDIDARQRLTELARDDDPLVMQLPWLNRVLPAFIAARLRRAARDRTKVHIAYQSLTRPLPKMRWIAPSRLISDGERWHTRAWCYEHEEWRDFVLARILDMKGEEPATDVPRDEEWEIKVALVLKPASRLSEDQQNAVAFEYGMTAGRLTVVIPKPLRLYALRRWGLDREDALVEIAEEIMMP